MSTPSTADTAWFTEARFGMFIHWGLYALGARHEWLMNNEEIDPAVYRERYFPRFNPDLYNPAAWAALAAGAGMRYAVITAKHHEGFCLWDSAHTDFKAPNTPAGRDLLAPWCEAFRAAGLRTGLYYSLLDWSHPDCVLDRHIGPLRNKSPEEIAQRNAGRDPNRYAAYMRAQTEELLTRYGDIDILWHDFSYPKAADDPRGPGKGRDDWQSKELLALIRRLRPSVILDDRLDLPGVGDVHTPEQFQPRTGVRVDGKPVVWEACQTLSGSWGYHRDESSFRDGDELIHTLIDTVSKGGNLLLNVGPTARGEIDARAADRLSHIGRWMRRHARAIHGCGSAPEGLVAPPDCRLTWNAHTNRLYVHCFAWPYKHLHIEGLAERAVYAQFLHDGSEVSMKGLDDWQQHAAKAAGIGGDLLSLRLPQTPPPVAVPVIEIELRS